MRSLHAVLLSIVLLSFCGSSHAAPGDMRDQLIFVWDGQVYAQSVGGSDLRVIGQRYAGMRDVLDDNTVRDVFDIAHSPLGTADIAEGFGLFHGIWSEDRTQFVYLTIGNKHRNYHVQQWQSGEVTTLLSQKATGENGFLDPVGFLPDGDILFIQRTKLHQVDTIQLWHYDLDTHQHSQHISHTARLTGSSALLPGGNTVFLGYEAPTQQGYLLQLQTTEITTFSMPLPDASVPKSIFELYPAPFMTIGTVPGHDVNTFIRHLNIQISDFRNVTRPTPFLYWPLADEMRSITCYPDSNWTNAKFAFTCPGLATPQDYDGHQGTDIGGSPAGLPIGTEVYPALPGIVVKVIESCDALNPSCGSAYGNVVMLEHIIILGGNATTWFTGYAHLSELFVEENEIVHNITESIAASGNTGIGGPHLHFEVRHLTLYGHNRWVDPWGAYAPPHAQNLWVGGNEKPETPQKRND